MAAVKQTKAAHYRGCSPDDLLDLLASDERRLYIVLHNIDGPGEAAGGCLAAAGVRLFRLAACSTSAPDPRLCAPLSPPGRRAAQPRGAASAV